MKSSRTLKTITHWIGGKPVAGTSGRFGPVYNPATVDERAR
jgi:malonate-semialdehyde dehydrogenase (acetylating) / methylmalonate-semialdehyde dehydrogenase